MTEPRIYDGDEWLSLKGATGAAGTPGTVGATGAQGPTGPGFYSGLSDPDDSTLEDAAIGSTYINLTTGQNFKKEA